MKKIVFALLIVMAILASVSSVIAAKRPNSIPAITCSCPIEVIGF